jgi:hypothetical protein
VTGYRGEVWQMPGNKNQKTKENAMIETRTVDLNKFKNAVGLTVTFSCRWGNTRKASMATVRLDDPTREKTTEREEKKAKERLQLKKQLVVSPEYDAIKSYFGDIRNWIYRRTVPSFFKEGFQLASLNAVSDIEDRLTKAKRPSMSMDADKRELPDLVEAFLKVYPRQIEEARAILEPVGQFNPQDYPTAEVMRGAFGINWNWIAFTVPESLPEALKQQETDKLERQLKDAGEQITLALRESFSDLVSHLTERLTVEPGEKKKTFRDTAIGNITEFLETFSNRNLMNDVELAALVGKAKNLLTDVKPDQLRSLASVRDNTLKGFTEIKDTLSKLIVTTPSRAFDFDDEPAPAATPATESQETTPQPSLALA